MLSGSRKRGSVRAKLSQCDRGQGLTEQAGGCSGTSHSRFHGCCPHGCGGRAALSGYPVSRHRDFWSPDRTNSQASQDATMSPSPPPPPSPSGSEDLRWRQYQAAAQRARQGEFVPSPARIAVVCAQIQSEWTEQQLRRAVHGIPNRRGHGLVVPRETPYVPRVYRVDTVSAARAKLLRSIDADTVDEHD